MLLWPRQIVLNLEYCFYFKQKIYLILSLVYINHISSNQSNMGQIIDETCQIVNTLLYESDDGAVSINVVMDNDNNKIR